jgi:tetratricopeptide (TPR) repeat protein
MWKMILLAFPAAILMAQTPSLDLCSTSLKDAVVLANGSEPESAIAAFTKLSDPNNCGAYTSIAANAFFYLGQLNIDRGNLEQARTWYARSVERDPQNGAALNNLAQLETAAGDLDSAKTHFEAAIALKTNRRPLYLMNYADLLVKQKRCDLAVKPYADALAAQPNNDDAEAKLIACLATGNPKAMTLTLWQSLEQGYVYRVLNEALTYADHDSLPEDVRRELMGIVAVSLARQHLSAEQLLSSPAGKRLAQLASSDAARDIVRLYTMDHVPALKSGWWSHWNSVKPPAVDSPTAFSLLARALATDDRSAGRNEQAETRLRAAVDVTAGNDPDAVVELSEYYADRGNIDKIDALLHEFEAQLFYGKSMAYERNDLPSIYRFHYALGTIYARLHHWGDSNDRTSAIFQLEHARDTALRSQTDPRSPKKLSVDPKVIDLLADSYQIKEPASGEAVQLRLDWTENYLKDGRSSAAQKVLKPYRDGLPETAKPADVNRYKELRTKVNFNLPTTLVPLTNTNPNTDPKGDLFSRKSAYSNRVRTIDDLVAQYQRLRDKNAQLNVIKAIREAGATDVRVSPQGELLVVMPDAENKAVEKTYAIRKSP